MQCTFVFYTKANGRTSDVALNRAQLSVTSKQTMGMKNGEQTSSGTKSLVDTLIWVSYSAVFDGVDSIREAQHLSGVKISSKALPQLPLHGR